MHRISKSANTARRSFYWRFRTRHSFPTYQLTKLLHIKLCNKLVERIFIAYHVLQIYSPISCKRKRFNRRIFYPFAILIVRRRHNFVFGCNSVFCNKSLEFFNRRYSLRTLICAYSIQYVKRKNFFGFSYIISYKYSILTFFQNISIRKAAYTFVIVRCKLI